MYFRCRSCARQWWSGGAMAGATACPTFLCMKLLGGAMALVVSLAAGDARTLRVCADPGNLPFSNQAGAGFENRIAQIAARDLDAKLEYTWWSERKSFVKDSLLAGRCDVILGIAAGMKGVLETRPYYRSTYVFVTRQDRGPSVSSLTDPRLAKWRIGIHVVGDDYAPPAQALARRGLSANLVGYSLFGSYGEVNPPAKIIDAVSNGDVDVAIVWGPFAGYFAKQGASPLAITPVQPAAWMGVPFTYDIAMAVRPGDAAVARELNVVLERECGAIQAILAQYGVPTIPDEETKCDAAQQSVSASLR